MGGRERKNKREWKKEIKNPIQWLTDAYSEQGQTVFVTNWVFLPDIMIVPSKHCNVPYQPSDLKGVMSWFKHTV